MIKLYGSVDQKRYIDMNVFTGDEKDFSAYNGIIEYRGHIMKKKSKVLGKVLLAMAAVLPLSLLGIYAYNRIKMKQEDALLENPQGKMVEVDGHRMCVYEEGEGDHTLLFLSGSGTPAPILDFKSLYSLLKDDYRIVVIEKFGYGFSDVVDDERSFDTILRQDREALEKAGIKGPFVLCPHSMSGLEAIMWAQDHPDEVESIIGLDMVLPRTYDGYDFDAVFRFEKLAVFARETGIIRFYYSDSYLPSALSKEEKEWLNDYHQKVYDELSPSLNDEEKEWLLEYTKKI